LFSKLKTIFGPQDMTVGNPLRSMVLFTIPLLLGNVLQLLYNTVDRYIVGNYCGQDQLSAIGVSMPVQFMFSVFFMTVGTGVSVMVSQYFGAKDKENLSKTVGSSIILTLIATLTSMILGLILSKWILGLINCPAEVFDSAYAYMWIMFLGFVGMGFYNILGGILRGLGDSTFPLVVLVGTTVLNIILDIWMVASPEQLSWGLGLGVAGAAWATIIAQTLSAVACLWRLMKMREVLELNRRTIRLNGFIVRQIVRIGLPSGIQQMIMSMSFVFVQSIINSIQIPFNGGHDAAIFVAVNTAVMSIDQFAMMPAQTFNMTSSTFTGQNIGAGHIDRVMKGFKICLTMALSFAIVIMILIYFFSPQLAGLFIRDPANPARAAKTIEVAIQMQHIIVWCYLLMGASMTLGGLMRGAGDTMAQLWIMISTNIIVRIPLTVLLVHLTKSAEYPAGKPEVIFYTMVISFALNVIGTFIYFSTGKWKTKSVIRNRQEPAVEA